MEAQNSKWVLVIDDDPEVCGILAEALGKSGFRVVQAAQVSEAKAKLAQQNFDCIVTDLYLGKGDGFQVVFDLRMGRGPNSKAPIMVMSAHLEIEMLKRLKPLVNTVLVKPFDMGTLLNRIVAMIGEAQVVVEESVESREGPAPADAAGDPGAAAA